MSGVKEPLEAHKSHPAEPKGKDESSLRLNQNEIKNFSMSEVPCTKERQSLKEKVSRKELEGQYLVNSTTECNSKVKIQVKINTENYCWISGWFIFDAK